jgi:hypothetical protein
MKIQSVVIWLLVVVLAAPSVIAASPQQLSEVWRAFAEKLQPGSFVRVRLRDGSQVKGHFLLSSGDNFQLRPKTRIPVPIRNFQFTDIESIDIQREGWSPGMKVLTGIGVGLGVVGAAFLIIIASIAGG